METLAYTLFGFGVFVAFWQVWSFGVRCGYEKALQDAREKNARQFTPRGV